MADVLLAELEPFKDALSTIVVESTFNWYWLVDSLMEQRGATVQGAIGKSCGHATIQRA